MRKKESGSIIPSKPSPNTTNKLEMANALAEISMKIGKINNPATKMTARSIGSTKTIASTETTKIIGSTKITKQRNMKESIGRKQTVTKNVASGDKKVTRETGGLLVKKKNILKRRNKFIKKKHLPQLNPPAPALQ